jgi:hypothetical protein
VTANLSLLGSLEPLSLPQPCARWRSGSTRWRKSGGGRGGGGRAAMAHAIEKAAQVLYVWQPLIAAASDLVNHMVKFISKILPALVLLHSTSLFARENKIALMCNVTQMFRSDVFNNDFLKYTMYVTVTPEDGPARQVGEIIIDGKRDTTITDTPHSVDFKS